MHNNRTLLFQSNNRAEDPEQGETDLLKIVLYTFGYTILSSPWDAEAEENSNKDFYNSTAEFCHDFQAYYCSR